MSVDLTITPLLWTLRSPCLPPESSPGCKASSLPGSPPESPLRLVVPFVPNCWVFSSFKLGCTFSLLSDWKPVYSIFTFSRFTLQPSLARVHGKSHQTQPHRTALFGQCSSCHSTCPSQLTLRRSFMIIKTPIHHSGSFSSEHYP